MGITYVCPSANDVADLNVRQNKRRGVNVHGRTEVVSVPALKHRRLRQQSALVLHGCPTSRHAEAARAKTRAIAGGKTANFMADRVHRFSGPGDLYKTQCRHVCSRTGVARVTDCAVHDSLYPEGLSARPRCELRVK